MDKQSYQIYKIFPNLFISILKFCGVLPLNFNLQTTCGNVAYSLFLLIVCFSVFMWSIPVVDYFEEVRESPGPEVIINTTRGYMLTKFVKVFYPIIMCCTSFVAIVNALWKYEINFPKYLKYLYECDQFLKKDRFFSETQHKLAVVFVTCCLGFSIPVKLFSVTSLALMNVLNEYVTFWIIFLYFIDMIGFVTEIQFVLMCITLQIRFKAINKILESLFSPHDIKLEYRIKSFADQWKSEKIISNKKAADKSKPHQHKTLLKCILQYLKFYKSKDTVKTEAKTAPIFVVPLEKSGYQIENPGTFFITDFANLSNKTVSISEADFSNQLHSLRLSHRHLCIALYFLKVMFEFVLLFSVFASFLLILLNSYFVIYGFVKIFILSTRFDVFFWILKGVFRFSCLLVMGDLTSNAARNTLLILSSNASKTFSKRTQEELQYFCQEIASRELSISCAFDLFVLKAELVTAAVGAISTYTVVLMQLHT